MFQKNKCKHQWKIVEAGLVERIDCGDRIYLLPIYRMKCVKCGAKCIHYAQNYIQKSIPIYNDQTPERVNKLKKLEKKYERFMKKLKKEKREIILPKPQSK